jgi:GT2 family glycosyltransferase
VGSTILDDSSSSAALSIVVPLAHNDPAELESITRSLESQSSQLWQLVVGTSSADAVRNFLDGRIPAERIAIVELPASSTLADGIALSLENCRGSAVAIVGPGDALSPAAVESILAALTDEVEVVYTDHIAGGETVLKPVFSPERLRGQDYPENLVAYRRTLLANVGEIRRDVAGAERYDLLLRATRIASRVVRIEDALFSMGPQSVEEGWSIEEATRVASTRVVLDDHLRQTGGGIVNTVSASGVNDTRRIVRGSPLVSIIIPTRGDSASIRGIQRCLVVEAVRGVVEDSTYKNVEIIIVLDDVSPPDIRQDLIDLAGNRIRFVNWSKPFSFSGKMNLGALHAQGDYLLLLNDDIEVISPDWIEAMLALAQRPKAGLVGAMLYFEDETIQHAGHAYYRSDVTHIGLNSERGAHGPQNAFLVEREVDGVTAACALVSRAVFLEVGGFSDLLPGNFNDVDLCMKVASRGYQSYWTPHAELYHYESKSRDPRVALYEIQTAWGRWEHLFWESKFWPMDPHTLYRNTAR